MYMYRNVNAYNSPTATQSLFCAFFTIDFTLEIAATFKTRSTEEDGRKKQNETKENEGEKKRTFLKLFFLKT